MNLLFSIFTAGSVIGAFCLGVWMGSHFYCANAMPTVKDDRNKDEVEKARTEADAERQRRFEEDLKAFEACMNYSLETAYGQSGTKV